MPTVEEFLASNQIAALRGECDRIGMKARLHDTDLHQSLAPAGPLARAIHDELESLRIEWCASRALKGVAANLAACFEYHYQSRGVNILPADLATSMTNAFVLMARQQLVGELPKNARRFVARWRPEIAGRAGQDIARRLARLAQACTDQPEFARRSRALIVDLELVDEPAPGAQAKAAESQPEDAQGEAGTDPGGGESQQDSPEGQQQVDSGPADAPEADEEESVVASDGDTDQGESDAVIPHPRNTDWQQAAQSLETREGSPQERSDDRQSTGVTTVYHAYTTRFDEVVSAADLIDRGAQQRLRKQLDGEISDHRLVVVNLASRLQRSLMTLQMRSWTFDLDDGLLDATRLSRLVIDPTSPLAYQQERQSEIRDTVVSFLIDNSGSMRGRPIVVAAMFADILAQALERCHIGTEILGFTTCRWHGGQTRQLWRSDGRPKDPGRLSDLRHIVYKAAGEPWRKARQSLGVMLWPDLLKENVDGEALLWAHRRLSARAEQRRILMVISDGVPADDATHTANAGRYLDTHLSQVVHWIENKSSVELLAIGIGHDVSGLYRHSLTIADSEQLGNAMVRQLVDLIGGSTTRHNPTLKTKKSAGLKK